MTAGLSTSTSTDQQLSSRIAGSAQRTPRSPRRTRQGCAQLLASMLVLLSLGSAQLAHAVVMGDAPVLYKQYRLYGDAVVTGNSLMIDTCPYVNTVLLSQSAGDVSGIPLDANLRGAFLFWSASNPSIDNSATLVTPSGTTINANASSACHYIAHLGGAYGCVADVTTQLAGQGGSSGFNGVYKVSGVNGQTGTVDSLCNCLDVYCQAKFAGWSLVLVYESPTERTERDVYLYDGFRALDEELTTPGQDSFTITGFNVGSPPEAKLSFFALEGDRQLGVPPQDQMGPGIGCPDGSCVDSLHFNGTPLFNSFNDPGNVFNSTVPGGFALGVDLDTYDVSYLVDPGDSSASVSLISGDGVFNNSPEDMHGWGEYFIVNWLLLRINRLSPNFSTSKTYLDVVPTEVAPGGTVFFTLTLTNDGSMNASNVVVKDLLPAGMEYIDGTTRVDGGPPYPGSPLGTGLNLGNIPHQGDNDRVIRFQARVLPTTAPGTVLATKATITATELAGPVDTNTVTVTVIGANLSQPTKIAKDLSGGQFTPADIVEYEVFIGKSGSSEVGGLSFVDTISPYVQLTEIPSGAFDNSRCSLNGGANGTGFIDLRDIVIASSASGVYVRYKVRVLSTAELIAKGVPASAINGLEISNQGSVTAPFLPSPLLTDDPAAAGATNPTVFELSTGVNFTTNNTRKTATDLNGGQLVPGDTIEFTIQIRNEGSQNGTVGFVDEIPAFLENVVIETPLPELSLVPPPAGANNTGRLILSNLIVNAGATATIRFRATVSSSAPNGAAISNTAQLTVVED
ncbi:MAG: hypothetical protein RBU37_05835, partial [Myxococcota bacterium]|nr:hypothetical protein [Myxococcota bacterium]